MRKVNRTALMPYSAAEMFDVVNDVSAYHEFLPWCISSEILREEPGAMIARLGLAKGGVTQGFTTRNKFFFPDSIHMELEEGPFSKLSGVWTFKQLGEDGCRIEMNLQFDFDSRLFNMTLARVFSLAADKMVDAFCERADVVYG